MAGGYAKNVFHYLSAIIRVGEKLRKIPANQKMVPQGFLLYFHRHSKLCDWSVIVIILYEEGSVWFAKE
jgi:hypothetical protein